MKRRSALLLATFLVAGCINIVAPPTGAPSTLPVAQATPFTVRPAETPTIRPPTAQPTPTPIVFDTGWLNFLVKQGQWLDTFLADNEAIVATDTSDMRGWQRVISTAYDNARDVQRELRAITPAPCFADLYYAQEEWIDTYTEALRLIDYGLSPPVTLSDMQAGADLLMLVPDLLADATALIDRVTCS